MDKPATSLQIIDPICWQGEQVPDRNWQVTGLIPRHQVTQVSGDGGVGKSILMLQLLVSSATGRPWLGMNTQNVKCIGLFCEDDQNELHRRTASIIEAYDIDFADLENLQFIDGVGNDSILMDFNNDHGVPTTFYQQVREYALDFGAQLVLVDSLHDVFAGNENIRTQARQFINLLRSLAIELDGAVVLNAHPSLSGLNSGSGTAGSTAWNNAVRSRLYLTKDHDGDDGDPDIRFLKTMKSNYAPAGNEIRLRWQNGVFVRNDGPTGIVKSIADRRAEKVFLTCLDIRNTKEQYVTNAKNSQRHAPTVFLRMSESEGIKKSQLVKAMNRLLDADVIGIGSVKGPDRHSMKFISRIPAAGSAGSDSVSA